MQDISEQIANIDWTVTNKVNSITRTSGSTMPNMSFDYDAMGNRVAKHVYGSSGSETITYYVRDAQGNEMASYNVTLNSGPSLATYTMTENPIYGSSRLGMDMHTIDMLGTNTLYPYVLGLKQYELSNHLGNVLATISDKKLAVNTSGVLDHFEADIQSAQDYYPFGELMPGRNWNNSAYRFGFNKGSEKDDEIYGTGNAITTEYRELDTRIGSRWWSIDPKPRAYESPYAGMGNNPILMNDCDGDDPNGNDPTKPASNQGDQQGLIRNATANMKEYEPVKAFFVDLSADLLNNFTPIGPLDNLIATYYDNTSTRSDKTEAVINFVGSLFIGDEGEPPVNEVKPKVPSPNGRNGGPEHQATVKDVQNNIIKKGHTYQTEVKVNTQGQNKNTRYMDVAEYDKNGKLIGYHQVGKQNKNGTPVSRERKAINDVQKSGDKTPIQYHPYNK